MTENGPVEQKQGADRVYLSPPHMSGRERDLVEDVFESNWIAPAGPHLTRFEQQFSERVGVGHSLAVSSGTAALHLALRLVGVSPGDQVVVSSLTFVGSVNPIVYLGAQPVLIDSEEQSWNLDPDLLAEFLRSRARIGQLPAAVVVVHLYGQSADMARILEACDEYAVPVIEDAAEALGATGYEGRSVGTFGRAAIFSFNGNKTITTSGGGMLVSDDEEYVRTARKLATQAREPEVHYEHEAVGYNYRLSNVLAAIGLGQLEVLEERVAARRRIFDRYVEALDGIGGLEFMPEAPWGRHARWLTTLTIDEAVTGVRPMQVIAALEVADIEARPLWKPMHRQPVFRGAEFIGSGVADRLFRDGLCLPSGSALSSSDQSRVVDVIEGCLAL